MNQVQRGSSSRFCRFERVRIISAKPHFAKLIGQEGTIIWRQPPSHSEWMYCVSLSTEPGYPTVLESWLESTGEFDREEDHLGERPEISYDVLPYEDGTFGFVEGSFRVPGEFWQVMTFVRSRPPEEATTLKHRKCAWNSGIKGITFTVPVGDRINKQYIANAMSQVYEVKSWVEICGPDSMVLR